MLPPTSKAELFGRGEGGDDGGRPDPDLLYGALPVSTGQYDDIGAAVRHAQALLDEMSTQPDYLEAIRVFGTREEPQWAQRPRPTEV